MKMPTNYAAFLRKIERYDAGETTDFIKSASLKTENIFKNLNLPYNFAPASYVLDYTTRNYCLASAEMSRITDHPVSYVLDGGLEFTTTLFHKADLKVYSEQVLKENLNFLQSINPQDHSNYLFSCNYRVRSRKGDYKNVIQQSLFIKSTHDGMPLMAMGFIFDISRYRNDKKIIHTIERIEGPVNPRRKLVLDHVYFADEREKILTRREIEILKYVCDEMDSASIADKLHISKHTVDNHRRSLLMKTNCKSSLGLIKFAMAEGYYH